MRKVYFIVFFVPFFLCFSSELNYYTLPDLSWSFGIDLKDFAIVSQKFNDNASGRTIDIYNKNIDVAGIITIEPAVNPNSKKIYDIYSSEIKLQYKKSLIFIKKGVIKDNFVISYKLKMEDGGVGDNLICFITEQDYQITLYLSSNNGFELKEAAFEMIHSIIIVNEQKITIDDLFEFGKFYFLNQNFFKSIEYFSSLLQIENIEKKISYKQYVDVITLSSYAYSVLGANQDSLDLLENGVKNYPEEPFFYYNIAVIMAFYDLKDEVFENLELAFIYASKYNRLYELPDPLSDSSFQSFFMNQENSDKISRIILNAKDIM